MEEQLGYRKTQGVEFQNEKSTQIDFFGKNIVELWYGNLENFTFVLQKGIVNVMVVEKGFKMLRRHAWATW